MKSLKDKSGLLVLILLCQLVACHHTHDMISKLTRVNTLVVQEENICPQHKNQLLCDDLMRVVIDKVPDFNILGVEEIVVYNQNSYCIAYKINGGKNYFWYYLKTDNVEDRDWFIHLEQFRDGLINSSEKHGWIINKMAKDF